MRSIAAGTVIRVTPLKQSGRLKWGLLLLMSTRYFFEWLWFVLPKRLLSASSHEMIPCMTWSLWLKLCACWVHVCEHILSINTHGARLEWKRKRERKRGYLICVWIEIVVLSCHLKPVFLFKSLWPRIWDPDCDSILIQRFSSILFIKRFFTKHPNYNL